ncbi:MAG: DUF58 domain-containing protein [Acidimicrobiia bacterium]|nr:DUF58 domain-containing protein [Acidimicrobiia bacterium]
MSTPPPPGPGRWRLQPTGPTLAAAVVLFVLYQLVVHSGSRAWPAPVVALATVALLLDAAVALHGQRRPELTLSLGPDATAGVPFSAVVTATQPAGRRVSLRVASLPSERIEIDAPSTGRFEVLAEHRGILRQVLVDVSLEGPLGLARVTRSVRVVLAEPLLVGPAPAVVAGVEVPPATIGEEARPRQARSGELTRTVREHRPGDPLRHIHWPATAHQGRLMTRELEQPAARSVRVVADLGPAPGAGAERAAAYAAHAVAVLLDGGARVELVTREGPRVVAAPVTTRRATGRRLAQATPGPPAPHEGSPALVVSPAGCRVEPSQAGAAVPEGAQPVPGPA